LETKQLESRGGGLFGANPLTGSIGVVTINMPKLAHSSATGVDFLKNLGKVMNLAKESLEIKRDVLEKFTNADLYPYTKFYLRGVKKRFHKFWTNHFSTIGLVGMNEACMILLNEDVGSKRGKKFAEKVLNYMRKRLLKYQQETGNNYNLEATPAEGTSYRLAIKDRLSDKDMICANNDACKKGAEPYYTNSTQLPVGYTEDMFEALDLQDDLQTKYTGGTVMHLFIGEKIEDSGSVKKLVKKICENYHLPYFTITPTFSVCPVHGYISGEHKYCPKCDDELLKKSNKKEKK
jgi:ribonucleoside-triphosphate reductase